MEKLLPDQLKELWQSVEQKQLTADEFCAEQERLLDEYRALWTRALLLEGHRDLKESTLLELGRHHGCDDLAEIQRRCAGALARTKGEWLEKVDPDDRNSVEQFYDQSEAYIDELMWWHTLCEDISPLG